jgi:dipeptidyl aminopeptidase/acylaminoacyl peptidase
VVDQGSGDVYVLRPDAETPRRVVAWPSKPFGMAHPLGANVAYWSPDRSEIAFTLVSWDGDPYFQVATVTAAGGRVRKLTPPHDDQVLGWSPDGRRVVYRRPAIVVGRALWAITAAGSREPMLVEAARRLAVVEAVFPVPSHDGAWLVGEVYKHGLRVIDSETLRVRRVTRGNDTNPVWSSDDHAILFTHASPGKDGAPGSNVSVISADGTGEKQLTSDGASWAVGWSPDGTKVLYGHEAHDPNQPKTTWSELWVMDADGGRKTRLPLNRDGQSVVSADWGTS